MLTQFQKKNCHPIVNNGNLFPKSNTFEGDDFKSFDQIDLMNPAHRKLRRQQTSINKT